MSVSISAEESVSSTSCVSLNVIKRNGQLQPYDPERISQAIKRAFLATARETTVGEAYIEHMVGLLTKVIDQSICSLSVKDVHIETIQDKVELALMRQGEQRVARAYVLYREKRHQLRQDKREDRGMSYCLNMVDESGQMQPITQAFLYGMVEEAAFGLEAINPALIIDQTMQNIYDGIKKNELFQALMLSSRTLVESEPNYSYVTARLLLKKLYLEVMAFFDIEDPLEKDHYALIYQKVFLRYIDKGISLGVLDSKLKSFDLKKLATHLDPLRDLQFGYLGLQTLYDRYFIHHKEQRMELPQVFLMRVAMGLAMEEDAPTDRAIEFYDLLSSFDFMCSTPTLFNSGTTRPQLSSCFLTTVSDDLDGIYGAIKDNALLSKFAGGLGNDWSNVRAMGARIKGTNGKSLGVIPFLNVADATAVAVNQGGKRKGAVCAYLESWHLDIEDFLDCRKNTGDERRRTHDMNTANWIPDLFMKRVISNGEWTLFSPHEVPDLHDLYGEAFEKAYVAYENSAHEKGLLHKKISAVKLWRKMLTMLFETGHPWVTFKDPCNIRSPQSHVGVVHSSNLCTEITLNTSEAEIAVCNLGSVNLPAHIVNGVLDHDRLKKTVTTAIRMLDNVIDINYYTVAQAKNSNVKHRPVGLGIMGFQDALFKQNLCYSSDESVRFADESMEAVSFYAIAASIDLAKQRGAYQSYEGSLWSQGVLPIDSIDRLKTYRQDTLDQDTSTTLDWSSVRESLKQYGIRNSNVMAIAPTATISNICGVSQSIEPIFQNLFVKSNMSGEFTVSNQYLVNDLKALGLWDEVMIHDLKFHNGSVVNISRIPDDIKKKYATAFEVDPSWLIEAASRRQKWIDQSQSLNLYIAKPSGKKLDALYKSAWRKGLKTTYYLRSMGATSTEKSTIRDNVLNAVSPNVKQCSIDDPDCEACQ